MPSSVDDLINRQQDLYTRIANSVDNLKKLGSASITLGAVESRLQLLESNWQKFEAFHEQILSTATEAHQKLPYFSNDVFGTSEEVYASRRGMMLDMLTDLRASRASAPAGAQLPSEVSRPRTSLPRIQLPQFAGRYTDWPAFRDLFYSLIIRESSLSNVERLHYLKTSVTGEAAGLLRSITTTEANFEHAWNTLRNRYENKRLLVAAQIGALSALAPMATESASELKRLLDSTKDAVAALDALACPITNGTYWLTHLTAERLDKRSRRDWETSLGSQTDPPTFDALQGFLEDRLRALESIEQAKPVPDPRSADRSARPRAAKLHHAARGDGTPEPRTAAGRCPVCNKNHYVLFCPSYQAKSPAQRKSAVDAAGLCVNCLGRHPLRDCQSSKRCQRCEGHHHTSLHDALLAGARSTSSPAAAAPTSHLAHTSHVNTSAVLLATARVRVFADDGSHADIRALVDPGSEVSLISEALVQRLRLRRSPASLPVVGVGSKIAHTTRGRITCSVSSLYGESQHLRVTAFVLPRLSAYRPRCSNVTSSWHHLSGLTLADSRYANADAIDLLLGADVYASLLLPGLRRGAPDAPVAQETIFGWILSGITSSASQPNPGIAAHQCSVDMALLDCVQRFWQQEEVSSPAAVFTPDELACETHYRSTFSRLSDGRYVVRLPLRRSRDDLGESRQVALRTLTSIERRFLRDPPLEDLYRRFISEYHALGHMVPCAIGHQGHRRVCYLPHHGVLKDGGKLRVVFNGSQPTTTGLSLNDLQHVGPKLQRDLSEVLLRWRVHRFVFTADIEKMYRQIRVHEDDWDLQRVLWRERSDSPAMDFHLTTVTYGQAAAPFLAIRTLRQLAKDEGDRFPRAAHILVNDVYVDDILSGAFSVEEAAGIASELVEACKAGGFPLGKWASNSVDVVSSLPGGEAANFLLEWPDPAGRSVLGLEWLPSSDCFSYRVRPSSSPVPTKRVVLSLIARLFDPLGWLAPITVRAKIFMQSLWLLKIGWDDPLPPRECSTWNTFQVDLASICAFSIPRWLGMQPDSTVQLFGFADASERALAAVVYLRAESAEGGVTVRLVAAKTRVAPIKQLALPRLELCAATLLVRLVRMIRGVLSFQDVPAHLYSDSTVVLGWIRSHPSRWKTFVANRVAEIQTQEPDACWRHIASENNPADCASRGLDAARLVQHSLWWTGPTWLSAEHLKLSTSSEAYEEVCEEARVTTHTVAREEEIDDPLLLRFSSWHRLLRVTAWCLRWSQIRHLQSAGRRSSDGDAWVPGLLRPVDLLEARARWVVNIQHRHFSAEVDALARGKPISSRSSLLRLVPFLDQQGQLRVGGRLKHALLDYDERHPIILPSSSHFTYLLTDAIHQRTLHGGVQLTLATLRRTFWILQGRRVVKSVVHRCLRCIRWRASAPQQLMAPLPSARVRPSRPFVHAGVDYAGPISLRTAPGRGHRAYKGYVAIFVCLATRAVHIEAVSAYSTDAFLAAYRRFAARRGLSAVLYSDCGTTFTGADAELRSLFKAASSAARSIAERLSGDGTEWRFNPPSAPHFGGLWEAAVKSTKHHLRRVLGETTLTFEEMSTLLTQIEACLNSRPLQPISDDPDDLTALTPAHFLVGSALNTVPEPSLGDIHLNRLTRWQMIQHMLQAFWRRWSEEYLTHLQGRTKWFRSQRDIRGGDMCLLRNDLLPPSKWPLARVTAVHPGEDGHVRVVTLRTASSTSLTRPISKIVRLPVREENSS